jgi:hypothetical protein
MNLSVTIPHISTPNLSALGKIMRGKNTCTYPIGQSRGGIIRTSEE